MQEKEILFRELLADHQQALDCPSNQVVITFFEELLSYLFPDYGDNKLCNMEAVKHQYDELQKQWLKITQDRCKQIEEKYPGDPSLLFDDLLNIRNKLLKDVAAIYEGDPAAKSTVEIVKTYLGFKAIAAYRIAHCLYNSGYVLIARMISEYAHSKTGVDIHPGANIDEHFCIDHATGIVIGETSNIGHHVKIYQGVTLGATSVDKSFASKKRHPTIGNHVVIYANATILGGETIIGDNSIIGGNSWITKSIPPNSKLYYDSKTKNLHYSDQKN
jgi:serine O-acetyltransferase